AAATRFYQAIGCKKNEQFSDHQASSMVWSDTITFQLLVTDYFAGFTPKKVADAHAACEVLLALSFDSRAAVDTIVEAAVANGGKSDVRELMDMGWMYNRAFEDPDGHVFEAIFMDMDAASAQAPD
ncbi:MAG: lactoylglutathione lyase, partial [Gemmatimonadales bacterium]|nr:lactoylglutathione lyase [Gemmatimonadales bacterium]